MPLPGRYQFGGWPRAGRGNSGKSTSNRVSQKSLMLALLPGSWPIRKPIDGVCLVPEFKDLFDCLSGWRSAKDGKPAV